MNITLYQIFYDDATRSHVDPYCIPYDNTMGGSVSLENRPIQIIVNGCDPCDYLGVLSWKFKYKVPIHITGRNSMLERMQADNYQHEVYSFFHNFHKDGRRKNFWDIADVWHPGISHYADTLFEALGLPHRCKDMDNAPIIYSNAHVTRYELYKQYVDELLAPALNIVEGDTELNKALFEKSRYKNNAVKKEQLIKTFGVDYYPMHPFVLERLFSTFLWMKQVKVKHIA